MIGTHQANRLRSIVMANLRPPKFPPRRDLELAAESQSNAQFVAFSDYFWLVDGRLAIVAARLQGRGVALALQAGALRQLLRATLTEFHEPGPALTTAQAYFSGLNLVGVDIAVLLTDPKSGRQESRAFTPPIIRPSAAKSRACISRWSRARQRACRAQLLSAHAARGAKRALFARTAESALRCDLFH